MCAVVVWVRPAANHSSKTRYISEMRLVAQSIAHYVLVVMTKQTSSCASKARLLETLAPLKAQLKYKMWKPHM